MKLLKFLSCMNCSGLGYCISGVAWRLLEGKKRREKVVAAGMGYCLFSKIESQYSRLTCIVAHHRLSRHTAA